jgi:hypothetical protein
MKGAVGLLATTPRAIPQTPLQTYEEQLWIRHYFNGAYAGPYAER